MMKKFLLNNEQINKVQERGKLLKNEFKNLKKVILLKAIKRKRNKILNLIPMNFLWKKIVIIMRYKRQRKKFKGYKRTKKAEGKSLLVKVILKKQAFH